MEITTPPIAARSRPLSRDAVVQAAIDLVTQDGLHALTMRRLGQWCDVEAMALYRHVTGRDDLIGGMVDRIVDDLYAEHVSESPADTSWQDYLQRLAHGMRLLARRYPELFPLIATRPPEALWVRPPLRSLRWMESFLASMLHFGFDDRGAVGVYRSFTTFLLGQLLLEVAAQGVELGPERQPQNPPSADWSEYPNISRLEPILSEDHGLAEFEDALESLLDRIARGTTRE